MLMEISSDVPSERIFYSSHVIGANFFVNSLGSPLGTTTPSRT